MSRAGKLLAHFETLADLGKIPNNPGALKRTPPGKTRRAALVQNLVNMIDVAKLVTRRR